MSGAIRITITIQGTDTVISKQITRDEFDVLLAALAQYAGDTPPGFNRDCANDLLRMLDDVDGGAL